MCGCHKAVDVFWATCHNRILNLLLSALFFCFFLKKNNKKIKKRWVFKRLPLYEGTAYILLKKRMYTD
jgi:hypothetical protein